MVFPGGSVDKNPPANAGFDPRSRKSPQAGEQLSLCAPSSEPACCDYWSLHPSARAPQRKPTCNKKPMHCNKEQPTLTATRAIPCAAMETQRSQNKQTHQVMLRLPIQGPRFELQGRWSLHFWAWSFPGRVALGMPFKLWALILQFSVNCSYLECGCYV